MNKKILSFLIAAFLVAGTGLSAQSYAARGDYHRAGSHHQQMKQRPQEHRRGAIKPNRGPQKQEVRKNHPDLKKGHPGKDHRDLRNRPNNKKEFKKQNKGPKFEKKQPKKEFKNFHKQKKKTVKNRNHIRRK